MRIALISDIHGNGVALEAALKDLLLHPADEVICLGDALQGGCEPARVVEQLRELGCKVVLGNSDSWILTGESPEQVGPAALEIRDWTRDQIGTGGLEFIESFPPTVEINLGDSQKLLCFHGSPNSFNDVILPESEVSEVEKLIGIQDARVLAGGHTHLQWTTDIAGSTFLNPGSIGVAYSRYLEMDTFYFYPLAEYAILEIANDKPTIEFCKVPFDVDELGKAARASGRPYSEGEEARYRPKST